MQRLDYNVLVPYLQPKHEYVLSISMTDLQRKLYKHYLENFAKAGQVREAFIKKKTKKVKFF